MTHPDHLNTPRLVADAAGTTVWRWDQQELFGSNPANEDPDANSVAFDLPLRLPGQRYDAESGLHYNYFRDYDPSLGNYEQSDLIGLKGGLNTYSYVRASPLRLIDLLGLDSFTDKAIEDLVSRAGGDISINVIEQILAQPCIARNCVRGGQKLSYAYAYAECMSDMAKVEKKWPGINAAIAAKNHSSEGAIGGCAAICYRVTNSPEHKKSCSRACTNTNTNFADQPT